MYCVAHSKNVSAEAILYDVDRPSSYAKTIQVQQKMVEEGAMLCYRSDHHALPMALLNPVFGKFFQDKSSVELRDILFCVDLCRAMQPLANLTPTRQESFEALVETYLKDSLPDTVQLVQQKRCHSIVDIRLQAKVSIVPLPGATKCTACAEQGLPHALANRMGLHKSAGQCSIKRMKTLTMQIIMTMQLIIKPALLALILCFFLQIDDQYVMVVYIEVKPEAGQSGDAQQQAMAYCLNDYAEWAKSGRDSAQPLRPAALLTVQNHESIQLSLSHTYSALKSPASIKH